MSLTHTLGFGLDYSILTALSDELSIQLRINRPQIHLFNQIHVLLMYAQDYFLGLTNDWFKVHSCPNSGRRV